MHRKDDHETRDPRQPEQEQTKEKKPFVTPRLTRHETLPRVTHGIVGSFPT